MKFSGLITALVLGVSSVAAATPAAADTIVRDHRYPAEGVRRPLPDRDGNDYRAPFFRGWQTLASGERLMRGRNAVQLYTPVRARMLKLEATSGATFVDKVVISFANGERQIVDLNRTLGRFRPLTIDVEGRSRMITRIVVMGRGGWSSSYNVLAA